MLRQHDEQEGERKIDVRRKDVSFRTCVTAHPHGEVGFSVTRRWADQETYYGSDSPRDVEAVLVLTVEELEALHDDLGWALARTKVALGEWDRRGGERRSDGRSA